MPSTERLQMDLLWRGAAPARILCKSTGFPLKVTRSVVPGLDSSKGHMLLIMFQTITSTQAGGI